MFLSVSNTAEVKRQTTLNRRLFWVGVAALLGAMVVLVVSAGNASLAVLVFLLGYPFLILGLVLSKRGSFNNRRHGLGGYKIKSESEMISEALQGVPPRYHLYNWINLNEGGQSDPASTSTSKKTKKADLPVEHLLVTPQGLMVIMCKPQMGDIKAGHDNYRRKTGLSVRFATLGEPGVGQPSRELAALVKKVRAWFEAKGYEIPTDGVVVFTNPRTKIIGAEEMSFPVCHIHDLKAAVRGWETELNMSVGEQQEVEDLIMQTLPAEVADEARTLAHLPGYKRAAFVDKQKAVATKAKEVKEKVKPVEEVLPKPRLTPEERERLRLERIRAAEEKGRQPVNPYQPPEPGKTFGLNGKVREVKPATVERKVPRRRAEPLRKPPPGAFGDVTVTTSAKKK